MDRDLFPKEKVAYDSPENALYIRNARLSWSPGMGFLCHWHDEVEFLYVRRGHVTYNVDGELYLLEEGQGIFVNACHLHFGFSADGTDADYLCILFPSVLLCTSPFIERSFIHPLLNNAAFPMAVLAPEVPWQKRVLELLLETEAAYTEKPAGWPLVIQSCYCLIWQQLFANQPPARTALPAANPRIAELKRMVEFINEHYRERITLKEISDAGIVCESSCARIFKKYLSTTPMAYLNSCRLTEGCRLLRETTLSLEEVAERAGFSSAAYFSAQFRRAYHLTPREYRRENRDTRPEGGTRMD